jgi:hypothetical protein
MCKCIYVSVFVCVYVYGCMPTCINIPTCTHTHTYTHIHKPVISSVLCLQEQRTLMVYKPSKLVWAAKIDEGVPCAMCVTTINGVNGMIVTLQDTGVVSCVYLGTAQV